MKAYRIIADEFVGGRLQLEETERPSFGIDEVLIKISAAGLNRADIFQRQGKYPPPKGASAVPGLEVSGVIEAAGVEVRDFKVGQRVCALLEGGGYAEYVSVKATQILPVPAGLSDVEAAALPETFFTVWYNLFQKANLKRDETLLVHGGSSGIGVTAIAMCKLLDIRCIVTTTSEEKLDKLKALGAADVVDARQNEMVTQVKTLTNEKGVDVILDMVGGAYAVQNLKMLAYGGRLAMIALVGGARAELNLASLLLKNLTITGATLRNQPVQVKAAIAQALRKNIWPLIEAKEYRPVIDRVFDFDQAMEAHRYMEENRHIGKIILQLC